MRFNGFLSEANIDSDIENTNNEFSKMSKASAEYALKIHYEGFIKSVRKNGSEQKIIDFCNRIFNCNISSLDELDFSTIKLRESKHFPTIDFNIIKRLTGFIGFNKDKIQSAFAFFTVLANKFGLR